MEKNSKLTIALITLLGALLTVLSGLLSISSVSRADAETDVRGLQQQVGALEQKVDLRDETIEELRGSNAALEQELDAVNVSLSDRDSEIDQLKDQLPGDTATAPALGTSAVRHTGEVTLANGGDGVNLNAPASDPTWGAVAFGSITSSSSNLASYTSGVVYFTNIGVTYLSGASASYEACSAATGYASGGFVERGELEGDNVCLRANNGRFATARLVETSPDYNRITLSITTWELADGD